MAVKGELHRLNAMLTAGELPMQRAALARLWTSRQLGITGRCIAVLAARWI
jgi:hypothetical protein